MELGWMAGWRTKAGVAANILAAIMLVLQGIMSEPVNWARISEGLAALGMALGMAGIRWGGAAPGTAAGQQATGTRSL